MQGLIAHLWLAIVAGVCLAAVVAACFLEPRKVIALLSLGAVVFITGQALDVVNGQEWWRFHGSKPRK